MKRNHKKVLFLILITMSCHIGITGQDAIVHLTDQQMHDLKRTMELSDQLHGRSQDAVSILIATVALLVGFGAFFGYVSVQRVREELLIAQEDLKNILVQSEDLRTELKQFSIQKEKIQLSLDSYVELFAKSIINIASFTMLPIDASVQLDEDAKRELNNECSEIMTCQELVSKEKAKVLTAIQQMGALGTKMISLPYLEWFRDTRLYFFDGDTEIRDNLYDAISQINNR